MILLRRLFGRKPLYVAFFNTRCAVGNQYRANCTRTRYA
jgi:hypothetical protein